MMRHLACCALLLACHKVAPTPIPAPTPPSPWIQARTDEILVDGQPVVPMHAGVVDPAELEGGAMGMKILKLSERLGQVRSQRPPGEVQISVEPSSTYGLLARLVYTASQASAHEVILVLGDQEAKVHLSDLAPAGVAGGDQVIPAGTPRPAPPLDLVVTVTHDKIVIWSASGLEGDVRTPAAELASHAPAGLGKALAPIKARHADCHEVIVMADGELTMGELMPLLVAAQQVFPDVRLGLGLQ
jgi:hypothetical protein